MPYDDPEPDDPQELIGMDLPGEETVTYEMAAAFADELAQLGFSRERILALFEHPYYAAPHRAWLLLGGDAIARLVDESLDVWGRLSVVVNDAEDDEATAGLERRHILRFIR